MFSVLRDLSVFGEGPACGRGMEIGMAFGIHSNGADGKEHSRRDGYRGSVPSDSFPICNAGEGNMAEEMGGRGSVPSDLFPICNAGEGKNAKAHCTRGPWSRSWLENHLSQSGRGCHG